MILITCYVVRVVFCVKGSSNCKKVMASTVAEGTGQTVETPAKKLDFQSGAVGTPAGGNGTSAMQRHVTFSPDIHIAIEEFPRGENGDSDGDLPVYERLHTAAKELQEQREASVKARMEQDAQAVPDPECTFYPVTSKVLAHIEKQRLAAAKFSKKKKPNVATPRGGKIHSPIHPGKPTPKVAPADGPSQDGSAAPKPDEAVKEAAGDVQSDATKTTGPTTKPSQTTEAAPMPRAKISWTEFAERQLKFVDQIQTKRRDILDTVEKGERTIPLNKQLPRRTHDAIIEYMMATKGYCSPLRRARTPNAAPSGRQRQSTAEQGQTRARTPNTTGRKSTSELFDALYIDSATREAARLVCQAAVAERESRELFRPTTNESLVRLAEKFQLELSGQDGGHEPSGTSTYARREIDLLQKGAEYSQRRAQRTMEYAEAEVAHSFKPQLNPKSSAIIRQRAIEQQRVATYGPVVRDTSHATTSGSPPTQGADHESSANEFVLPKRTFDVDVFCSRQDRFLSQRATRVANLRRERKVQEIVGCTFRPAILSVSATIAQQRSFASVQREADYAPAHIIGLATTEPATRRAATGYPGAASIQATESSGKRWGRGGDGAAHASLTTYTTSLDKRYFSGSARDARSKVIDAASPTTVTGTVVEQRRLSSGRPSASGHHPPLTTSTRRPHHHQPVESFGRERYCPVGVSSSPRRQQQQQGSGSYDVAVDEMDSLSWDNLQTIENDMRTVIAEWHHIQSSV